MVDLGGEREEGDDVVRVERTVGDADAEGEVGGVRARGDGGRDVRRAP